MSEKRKRKTGCVFLAVGFLLCIISAYASSASGGDRFRPANRNAVSSGQAIQDDAAAVRVNTAEAEELMMLPGIGETLASLIISERENNGEFYYPEDLETVKGIGPQTLKKLRPLISTDTDESGD